METTINVIKKLSTDELRKRIGQNATNLPTIENDLERSKVENIMMKEELHRRES